MFGQVPSVLTSSNVTVAGPQLSVAVSVAAGTVAISEHSTVWSAGRASTNTWVRIVNDVNSLNVLSCVAAKVSSNPGSCQSISVRACTVSSNFGQM